MEFLSNFELPTDVHDLAENTKPGAKKKLEQIGGALASEVGVVLVTMNNAIVRIGYGRLAVS